MKLHLHKYSKWSVFVESSGGHLNQYKVCEVCGKRKRRRLYYHGVNAESANSAIRQLDDALKGAWNTRTPPPEE